MNTKTRPNEQAMTVTLPDGTEGLRPFSLKRNPQQDTCGPQPEPKRVPTTYPGEEAIEEGGKWVIRRVPR